MSDLRNKALFRGTWFCNVAVVIAGLSGIPHAEAGGIYASEIGSPNSLGTAGSANVTNRTIADAAWTNPAGMTGINDTRILTGLQVLVPKTEFESTVAEAGGSDGGNAGNMAAIPSFFYVKTLNEDWRFGLSMVAPFGGGYDFGDDFVGRYVVEEITLQGLAVSPSLGYRINDKVSVGFGVSVLYTVFDMKIAINQSGLGAPDGKVDIDEATDVGYQPFIGLQWQVSDRATFGAVYRAEADIELDGDVTIDNLVLPLEPQSSIDITWDNPQLLEIGLRYKLNEEWSLTANANWEDWSAFSVTDFAINDAPTGPVFMELDRNWKDTYKFGVGVFGERGDGRHLAFGASYDTSPVDSADRTIDLPSDEQLRLSAAYGRDSGGRSAWGIGATLLWLGNGKVDQVAGGARFAGEFDKNWILFVGGMYQRRFGQ